MEPMLLTSTQNPRIKQVIRWRDRPDRDRDQVVLLEGYRALSRAEAAGFPVTEVYFCPELYIGENEPALLERLAAKGARLFQVAPGPFAKMTYRDRPEGLLGIGRQVHRTLEQLQVPEGHAPFYLVAEQIEKPGNLGTMLRSADAAGVDALVLCDPRTDLWNPNVVRSSTGVLFSLPIPECASRDALQYMKSREIQVIASSPHAKTLFTDVDLTGPVAMVVGSEQVGLSSLWMDHADQLVRLPMMGAADSLNVATATTILLYEVLRQRLARGILSVPEPAPDEGHNRAYLASEE